MWYFLDVGENKNYLKGKEQIFDLVYLYIYRWVGACVMNVMDVYQKSILYLRGF